MKQLILKDIFEHFQTQLESQEVNRFDFFKRKREEENRLREVQELTQKFIEELKSPCKNQTVKL